jgi:uncharacterized protein YceH (UPF0502 family)
LLCGAPLEMPAAPGASALSSLLEERVARLEQEVAELRAALASLSA